MSGGAVIIIIDPNRPQQQRVDGAGTVLDGFAQDLDRTSPYGEALDAIREAEAAGARVRIIGD